MGRKGHGIPTVRDNLHLELFLASLLADIVCGVVAAIVIPEVIASPWEERVMVFPQYETIFIVIIIRLPISPVKPRHRLVLVRPPPLSLVMVGVVASSGGSSKPES